MPLVFGVTTFDGVGPPPPSPWADLCSLLADCVCENVVLIVDDRMRLIEEISRFIVIHRRDIPAAVLVKLQAFIAAMHNAPHCRIPLNVDAPDGAQGETPASIAARVIARVGRPLDFEYAFPGQARFTGVDGSPPCPEKNSDQSVAPQFVAPTLTNSIATSDESSTDASPGVTNSFPMPETAAELNPFLSKDEILEREPVAGTTDTPPPRLLHAESDNAPGDATVVIAMSAPVASCLQPGNLTAVTSVVESGEDKGSGRNCAENDRLYDQRNQRTNEYIPFGSYQASSSVDLARKYRSKTSFGDKHDVKKLAESLGRALWFTEEITLLDSVIGTKLYLVREGTAYECQEEEIRRFIDSLAMYAAIADSVRVTASRPLLVLRSYCQPGKPGPTRRQLKHFEKLVTASTGFKFQCDLRQKVGGGKSAHDRYLVVSHCCVELGGGIDVASTQSGSGRKKTRPEKHFRFLPVTNVASDDSQELISDVQADLKRYDNARPYVHPRDKRNRPAFNHRR